MLIFRLQNKTTGLILIVTCVAHCGDVDKYLRLSGKGNDEGLSGSCPKWTFALNNYMVVPTSEKQSLQRHIFLKQLPPYFRKSSHVVWTHPCFTFSVPYRLRTCSKQTDICWGLITLHAQFVPSSYFTCPADQKWHNWLPCGYMK